MGLLLNDQSKIMRTSAPVVLFLVLAFGLSWLLAVPLWRGQGLKDPLFLPLTILIMWTPALAAFLATRLTTPRQPLGRSLGLVPWRPLKRTIGYSAFGLLAGVAITVAALVLGQLVGVYQFDLAHFSAFDQTLRATPALTADKLAQMPPLSVLVLLQLVALVPGSLITALAAAGEEIGWRGFLLPRLMPLGTGPAIVISGVIWGLWHAPLILLGYNYPTAPGWLGLLCMCAACIMLAALMSWLRLRSGSVWPCALAHGAVNSAAGMSLLLGMAGHPADTTQTTVLGWTGWIVTGLLAWALFRFQGQPHGAAA